MLHFKCSVVNPLYKRLSNVPMYLRNPGRQLVELDFQFRKYYSVLRIMLVFGPISFVVLPWGHQLPNLGGGG